MKLRSALKQLVAFFYLANFIIGLSSAKVVSSRIVGGDRANLTDVHYQISVQTIINATLGNHICGGVVYSNRTVITAAHCMYARSISGGEVLLRPNEIRIVSGTINVNNTSQGQVRGIREIVIHKDYKPGKRNYDNDIALLLEGGRPSFELMRVHLPIADYANCKRQYPTGDVTSNMLCAGSEGKAFCDGDDGGPLVCGGELSGIASFGHKCGHKNFPGIYTEVAKYADWVKTNGGLALRIHTFVTVVSALFVSVLYIYIE